MASLDVSPVGINVIVKDVTYNARDCPQGQMDRGSGYNSNGYNNKPRGRCGYNKRGGGRGKPSGEYTYHSRKDSTNGATTPPHHKQKSNHSLKHWNQAKEKQ